jgi:hypothetical protein
MLEKIWGSNNLANILTKGIALEKLKLHKTLIGLQR